MILLSVSQLAGLESVQVAILVCYAKVRMGILKKCWTDSLEGAESVESLPTCVAMRLRYKALALSP